MNKQQLSHIQHIQQAQREGRLALFVGAGVSRNSGIPTWDELINRMKEELPDTLSKETDALKLAQMYKDARGHKEYMDKVKDVLLYNKAVPNSLHKNILSLKPCHIITTNYDDLIEQEIRNEFALFDIVHQDSDIPRMSYPNALIKMHGDYETDNIVLTEHDYYNYSYNFPLVRALVQSIFASKLVLFVGFSFADLNLKMIMNELKNILSENMQRAYLVSIDKPDELTNKYFENKGINIVYLEENEIKELAGKEYIDNPKNDKGILLENILTAINSNKDLLKHDLATCLYNKIVGYQTELRSFGDGLRYLFPDHKNIMWNTHSDGLQTYSDYFVKLGKELRTNSDKRKFLIRHPEINIRTLFNIAYHNYLGEIDGIEILDEKFNENVDSYIEPTVIDYIRNFDFEQAKDKIIKLHSRPTNNTIDDLEYPFYLYYVGKYWEAYQCYSSLLSKYWEKQKYILYFICRYNMWSIRNGVWNQRLFDNDFDADKDLVLANENLDDILSKLPLDEEIRRLLGDVISYRQVGNRLQKTDKLREDIYAQRISSLKGGCSINSNITNLLALHQRERLFWNSNYIISNNNSHYSALCYNMVLSILNSLSTKTGYFMGEKLRSSKLTRLNVYLIKLLMFEIDAKELNTIIDAYEITDIVLHDDAVEFINKSINTVLSSKETPYYKDAKIVAAITNIIILILASKEYKFDSDNLYRLIAKFWNNESKFGAKRIKKLIGKYHPSIEISKILINKMLYETRDTADYHESMSILARLFKEADQTFEDILLDDLSRKKEAISATILYPIAPKERQSEMSKFCLENMTNLYHYLFFICHNSVKIKDTSKFTELYNKERDLSEHECDLLAQVRRNDNYRILHNLIDEYSANSKCLQFFLKPEDFSDIDEFDGRWALTLYPNHEDRVKFFRQDKYREKLKELINNNYWDAENREYLISIF